MRSQRRHYVPMVALMLVIFISGAKSVESGKKIHMTTASVRALTPEEAMKRPAVQLRGVITYARHGAMTDCTLQDGTGGVWLLPMLLPENCRQGALVEVEGNVEPGALWPVVRADKVKYIGAGILPAVRPATYEELLSGMLDCLRVEVVGVVRNQRVNPELDLNWLVLEIASGGGRFTTHVTHEITGHPELVGARVRLNGVCLNSADPQRQAFLPRLNLTSLADLEVLRPAGERPFEQPVRPLSQILRPTVESESGQQIRVRGIVSLQLPNGEFFLQDETRGLRVFPNDITPVHVGEIVDVIGFPEAGEISPVIRDADWRLVGTGKALQPRSVETSEAVEHDGELLKLKARLVDQSRSDRGVLLAFESEGEHFTAHLPAVNAEIPIDRWRPGSELAVTGVCVAQVGSWERFVSERRPQAFQLLLRSSGDVQLLRKAPISVGERVAWSLGSIGTMALITLIILQIRSRRRLNEQARERATARVEFKAVLAERNRMAREIHDTLAQGFVVISAHLEALNDRLTDIGKDTRKHLDWARELARENLEEARRTVWNMRSQFLESGDLATALERLGRELTNGTTVSFSVQTVGRPRRLSPEVENNLLRIGQEALTNAIRHAQATRLHVALQFSSRKVGLQVTDDGSGLDLNGTNRVGSFGLAGMRERCEEIGATFQIESSPGKGTKIDVAVHNV